MTAVEDDTAADGGPLPGSRPQWTRQALRAVASGKTVKARGRAGETLKAPSWLVAASKDTTLAPWETDLSPVHPLDRVKLFLKWMASLEQPGELLHTTYRFGEDDGEHERRREWINLLEDQDVGAVITFTEDLGRSGERRPWVTEGPGFSFSTTNWVIEHFEVLGTRIWVEGCVEEIYGRRAEEMIGFRGRDLLHANHHDAIVALWIDLLLEPSGSRSIRLEVVRPDGTTVWIETTLINRLQDERIGAVVSISHDITQQRQLEALEQAHADELQRSRAEFQTLAEQVPAAVFRTDGRGVLTFANRRFHELIDHADGVVADLRAMTAPEDLEALLDCLGRLASPVGPDVETIEVHSGDGARLFSLACRAVGVPGGESPRAVVGSIEDVTAQAELRHDAAHDALTGLLNRGTIDRCLRKSLLDDRSNLIVAFIDLDGFKAVNDESGHDAGDAILREVGRRFRLAVRPGDEVGRYGGDEFVLICHDAMPGTEDAVVERIQQVLVDPIVSGEHKWEPAASVGLVRPRLGEHAPSVLRRADRAMYESKRNRIDGRSLS